MLRFSRSLQLFFQNVVLQVTHNYVFPPFVATGALKTMRPRVTTVEIQTLEDLVCTFICMYIFRFVLFLHCIPIYHKNKSKTLSIINLLELWLFLFSIHNFIQEFNFIVSVQVLHLLSDDNFTFQSQYYIPRRLFNLKSKNYG